MHFVTLVHTRGGRNGGAYERAKRVRCVLLRRLRLGGDYRGGSHADFSIFFLFFFKKENPYKLALLK